MCGGQGGGVSNYPSAQRIAPGGMGGWKDATGCSWAGTETRLTNTPSLLDLIDPPHDCFHSLFTHGHLALKTGTMSGMASLSSTESAKHIDAAQIRID